VTGFRDVASPPTVTPSVPAWLDLSCGARAELRTAVEGDIPALVRLLAADQLGAHRELIDDPGDLEAYRRAFEAIERDPMHLLIAAWAEGGLAATMQLSFLPGLARRGGWRAQLEALRVAEPLRGRGLGEAMMRWAVAEARRRGCSLVQLTTDKRRPDAHRFYARLGFEASHEGMKLLL